MPTLRLTNLLSYKNYFSAIAQSHVAIDGFKWGDSEVMQNDSRSDMAARVLWAVPYEQVSYNDSFSDNITKSKVARVAYMVLPDSELYGDEDEALEDCEKVIEDIIAKIYKDKQGEEVVVDDVAVWQMVATTITGITLRPVTETFGSTEYIGMEMSITFIENTGLTYNAAKWQ